MLDQVGEERRIGVLYLDSREKGALLSRAARTALETLAIVAYRQPIGRAEIEGQPAIGVPPLTK